MHREFRVRAGVDWPMSGGPVGLKCDFCVKIFNFGLF